MLASRVRQLLAPVALVALSVALSGCPDPGNDTSATESSSTTSDTGEPVVPLTALEEACAGIFGCSCALYLYEDEAACVAAEQSRVAELEATAAANGLTVDEACVVADLDFNRFGCGPWPDAAVEFGDHGVGECPGCQLAYGTKGVGEACTSFSEWTSDCAQGLLCAGNIFISEETFCYDPCAPATVDAPCPAAGCGDAMVCTRASTCAPKIGRDGDECSDADVACGPGLACDLSLDEDAACFPGYAPGDGCGDCWYCCAGDNYCAASVCEPLPGAGELCGEGGECADGLYCEDGSAECAAIPGVGEACDYLCAAGSHCDSQTGTCLGLPGVGEACGDGQCAAGLDCGADDLCFARAAVCAM